MIYLTFKKNNTWLDKKHHNVQLFKNVLNFKHLQQNSKTKASEQF